MEIDEKDRKILNALVDDATSSCRETAGKAGVSAVTVLKRVKALKEQGIIQGYTARLDYEKLGYDVQVIIKMRISKGRLFDVEKKIASHKNVFAVYDVTGHDDAIVIAKFKNRRSMDAFLKSIQKYDFVERTETQLILNTIKEKPIQIE